MRIDAFTPHQLRHTFCTLMYFAKQNLGHRNKKFKKKKINRQDTHYLKKAISHFHPFLDLDLISKIFPLEISQDKNPRKAWGFSATDPIQTDCWLSSQTTKQQPRNTSSAQSGGRRRIVVTRPHRLLNVSCAR